MRTRIGPMLGAALLVLLAAGCASTKPCMVIPRQLELAQHERDTMKQLVDAQQAEVNRSKENLDLAKTRLQQMEQERDELQKAIVQQAADSAAARGKKK